MASQTSINKLPYPNLGDSPNIETAVEPLALALDNLICPVFGTVTARDLAIPVPQEGMMAYCKDSHEQYVYGPGVFGNAWLGMRPRTGLIQADSPGIGPNDFTWHQYNGLSVTMEAGACYLVTGSFRTNDLTSDGGGIALSWGIPSGSNGSFNMVGGGLTSNFSSSNGVAATMTMEDFPWNTSGISIQTANSISSRVWVHGFLDNRGGTGGSLTPQFGNSHTGHVVQVRQYSYISLLKVG